GVCVVMGHGDATFERSVSYTVQPFPPGAGVITDVLAAGDADGDGFPDLVVGHELGHGIVTVLRNRGDGTFGDPEYHYCGRPDACVGLADLRGSGRPDLLVLSCPNRSSLGTFLSDGHGGWLDPSRQPGWNSGLEFFGYGAAADLDGDGAPD